MEVKIDQQKIKELRLARSWSQEKLADEAGVSLRTVQRMELDGSASLKSRLAVAQAFDIEPGELDRKSVSQSHFSVDDRQTIEAPQNMFKDWFAYPGPKEVGPKIRAGVLIFFWVMTVVTGGVLLLLGGLLTILAVSDPEIPLTQVLLASTPVAIVFAVNAGLLLFFKRILSPST